VAATRLARHRSSVSSFFFARHRSSIVKQFKGPKIFGRAIAEVGVDDDDETVPVDRNDTCDELLN
jgi:hypothetical protein